MTVCLTIIGVCYGVWAVSIICGRHYKRRIEWRRRDWAVNERLERLRKIQGGRR